LRATPLKRTKKKRRGVFYTPDSVTNILCEWAIRNKEDSVLEPSFGGCGFIQALSRRFKTLGRKRPATSIFGCDIDSKAFTYLIKLSGAKPILNHFIKGDFLEVTPSDFADRKFNAVIGNPPYVSYHNMFDSQRQVAVKLGHLGEFKLGRVSSLWAYFVLHGCSFLKSGGRAAWVLPGSLLNSDYGKQLLHGIAPQFKRVVVVSLSQRLFLSEGTDESTEILLCDGWQQGPAQNGVEVRRAATIDKCRHLISSWHLRSWKGTALNGRAMFTLFSRGALSGYHELLEHESVTRLGNIAKILIGIVTGDNKFFVIDKQVAGENNISSKQLSFIFSKFRYAPGLLFRSSDLVDIYESGGRCLLVNRPSVERSASAVKAYLETFPKDLIETNATFAKRGVWHCPDDGKIPDGFFPYMNHAGPRIVLNNAEVNSTNTIHRLYFPSTTITANRKLAAISILTTFSQLSAEIEGRTYGSGVLKHEPSEAMNIRMFMPTNILSSEINKTAKKIDRLLRAQSLIEAQEEADTLIFGTPFITENENIFASLRTDLRAARKRRY
jgi:adenine-specific DNA-methyltransferase